jgi:hypothetical protein
LTKTIDLLQLFLFIKGHDNTRNGEGCIHWAREGGFTICLFFFPFSLSLPISGCHACCCLSEACSFFFFSYLSIVLGGRFFIKVGEPNRFSCSAMGWNNVLFFSCFSL